MATTTLWLVKKKAPDLSEALQILLSGSAEYSLAEPPELHSPVEKPDVIGLIPWFSLRDGAFSTDLYALWKEGCRRFVLVTPSSEHPLPWVGFPAHLRTAFDVAIQVCDTPSWERLQKALGAARSVELWANRRVQEYVEARTLYTDLLSIFSHNSKTDLSNQFLAPARLLRREIDATTPQELVDKWKKIWVGDVRSNGFVRLVLKRLTDSKGEPGYGALGEELAVVARRITKGLCQPATLTATNIENLMTLLTEIRTSAGVRTHAGDSSGSRSQDRVEPICAKNADAAFRVLVVDDHAASWRPVFEELQQKLAEPPIKLDVSFEFSLDGKTLSQSKADDVGTVHFNYYDLVILDVFLGGTTGIKILELLRRDFSQLPVLLWTTSRDEEITAEATLANGILLKKTVTWEALVSAVARWVERGKAMRTASLPNPFFNHTITNLKYRQLAVDFHEWCLKQLDSFHALDGEYFRYFTDHGGRHIVKLWELMEQALQPFLQDDKEILLPKEKERREFEILGLYLTVICHELGMFPMRINGRIENFGGLDKEFSGAKKNAYPDDVRTLHAPRGMLMLFSGTRAGEQFWNDHRGERLGSQLKIETASSGVSLGDRVAVLTGYHARCFKSLDAGHFLKWDQTQNGFGEKVSKLNLPQQWPNLLKAIGHAFTSLDVSFNDEKSRERLRLQCAVFRFVDALDITHTRNPAEFLAESGNLPAKQHGENLKRELCESATIHNGKVSVTMLAPLPDVVDIENIIYCVSSSEWGKDVNCRGALAFFKNKGDAGGRIQQPWKLDEPFDLQSSVLCLQKPLDCWLKEFWRVLMSDTTGRTYLDAAFILHLNELGVLEHGAKQPKLTQKGARIVASITALSVAGEIIDEFEAIIEAELTDKLRLDEFKWDERHDWNQPLPNCLTTLKKAITITSAVVA